MGAKKRRTKADVALDVLKTDLGQQLLEAQAGEIEKQLAELEAEQGALRSQLDSIEKLRGSKPNGRPSTKGKANGERKAKRTGGRGVNPDRVLAALAEADKAGFTIGEIGKAIGARPDRVRPVLHQLLDDKAVKKRGQRRSTRYSVR